MKKNQVYLSVILSVVLFLGGVALVIFHPPFWGLFLGIPATIMGIALTVLTFDQLNQLTLEDEPE